MSPSPLDVEAAVAQLLCVGLPDDPWSAVGAIEAGGPVPGAFMVYRESLRDGPAKFAAAVAAIHDAAAARGVPPPLFAADHEGGHARLLAEPATATPSAMGLGAIPEPSAAGIAAGIGARELRAVGVTWNLAPVADVDFEARNPVIGARAYGDRPTPVAERAVAAALAMRAAGVLACGKHFPGHGGTTLDSHVAAPVVDLDADELNRRALPPFSALIRAGVESVMVGHLRVPALDPDRIATVSPRVIGGLLREELGFRGVVVTDSIDMAGATPAGGDPAEASVDALAAGVDVVLAGNRLPAVWGAIHAAIADAVRRGRLPADRVEAALARVFALKARAAAAGPLKPDPAGVLAILGRVDHRAEAESLHRRALTLVRASPGALPLPLDGGAGLLVLAPTGTRATCLESWTPGGVSLGDAVRGLAPGAALIPLAYPLDPETRAAALLAAATARVVVVGLRSAAVDPEQAAFLAELRSVTTAPLIGVGQRTPHDFAAAPGLDVALCAYSDVAPAMHAAAEALFGLVGTPGRLPVSVDLGDTRLATVGSGVARAAGPGL